MTHVALVSLVTRAAALMFAAGACSCSASAQSCALNVFADVATHVATKVPLNTQSGCSGYSTVPLASDTQAVGDEPMVCTEDTEDSACLACLRVACCAIVGQTCAALDPATCAAVPGVSGCINGALAGTCAEQCPGVP